MNATSAQPISVKALADAVLARNSGRNERTTRELRPPQLEACETPQKLRQLRPEVDPESQLLRRLSLACDGVCFPDGSPFTVQFVYASSREDAGDRATRHADRLRARLGWEPGILNGEGDKPKWKRWCTFERLAARHDDLVGRSMQAMMLKLGLFGRDFLE